MKSNIAALALLLVSGSSSAASLEVSGLGLVFPGDYVQLEEKRELTSKDRFVHEIGAMQTLRNSANMAAEGNIVVRVDIRYMPALELPAPSETSLAAELEKARKQVGDGSVQMLGIGRHKGLMIDTPYTPPQAKPDAPAFRFASATLVAAGARINLNVMYAPKNIATETVLAAIQAMSVDEARIKALVAESEGIRKAAVSGSSINTQAGSFELPSGTSIRFGTLAMVRKEAGSTVMTSFFAQRDGFWTSQRAGIVITCLPGGITAAEEQDKAVKTVLDSAKAEPAAVKSERFRIAAFDAVRAHYTLSSDSGSLATHSWFVFGEKSTIVATLMGITTEKFQQQFEKSTALARADCSVIPGSQLEAAEPVL